MRYPTWIPVPDCYDERKREVVAHAGNRKTLIVDAQDHADLKSELLNLRKKAQKYGEVI